MHRLRALGAGGSGSFGYDGVMLNIRERVYCWETCLMLGDELEEERSLIEDLLFELNFFTFLIGVYPRSVYFYL